MEDRYMTIKEAIKYITENYNIPSMYALSKVLSDETMTVQPIQLSKYLRGHKPSEKVAKRFLDTFDIVITDVYYRPCWKDYIGEV